VATAKGSPEEVREAKTKAYAAWRAKREKAERRRRKRYGKP